MSTIVLVVAGAVLGAGAVLAWLVARRRSGGPLAPGPRRVLFPIVGTGLSERALNAALRSARADGATLVPAYLATVPWTLPLESELPRECEVALPLLEAIEQQATAAGVPVDSRIERGRSPRHALRELIEHEPYERIVVPAEGTGVPGFSAADVAWLLRQAPGEIVVLRASEAPVLPLGAPAA